MLPCVYNFPPPLLPLQHNVVGRILGPQGTTIKRIQAETQCKISILGAGSMRDKRKEEELRTGGDPKYSHLSDGLHVLVEAQGPYDIAQARRAAGVAEVRKMLLPPVSRLSMGGGVGSPADCPWGVGSPADCPWGVGSPAGCPWGGAPAIYH